MAARRLQCWECGTAFYGRADARFCSGACRQKSHRAGARRRAAEQTVTAPGFGDAVARAREGRESARAARERARVTREASAAAAASRAGAGAPRPIDNRPI
ncbi:hypothetical protein [Mycobacterium paraffinicum]|uniref:Uncharacterized protein n=1 Tax=Mycobacterium paraffinicum TaxID=53378 RepID=A0ABP8RPN5_9MYCO|nr:hypothetical protein [Mycobacterium paraffinicum]MCV7310160.1 hypothetical protein [Mycobacterium paraffinicum]